MFGRNKQILDTLANFSNFFLFFTKTFCELFCAEHQSEIQYCVLIIIHVLENSDFGQNVHIHVNSLLLPGGRKHEVGRGQEANPGIKFRLQNVIILLLETWRQQT
jgi:hypothetical protein